MATCCSSMVLPARSATTTMAFRPRPSATCVVKKNAVTYSLTNLDLWHLYKSDNFTYVIILQNICSMLSRRLRKADSRIVEFLEVAGAKPAGKAKATKRRGKA